MRRSRDQDLFQPKIQIDALIQGSCRYPEDEAAQMEGIGLTDALGIVHRQAHRTGADAGCGALRRSGRSWRLFLALNEI